VVATELGVEVDLLTYGEGEDVDVPGIRIVRIPRFAALGSVPIGPSYLKLFLDAFVLLWATAMLLRRRYDFVHAHEEAVFLCLLLQPVFRFRLVYDMHSSLPEQLRNYELTGSPLLIRAFHWLERRALERAAAVITICPELADYALAQGVEPERHFLIENTIFEPVRVDGRPSDAQARVPDVEAYLEALPGHAPLVFYAGTLEPYQGIDLLIAAFAQLRERVPEARLLVLGGDPDQCSRYRDAAKSAGLERHSLFAGRVPQDAVRRHCERATVQVSPRASGSNTPLKLYEQLASGIPIVATRVSSHLQVLDENMAFLTAPEPDALAAALERAVGDAALRAEKAEVAARIYRERYSRARYVHKMSELLKGL
jgi:glycosyltransferase involved in cell wall biosynthesis